MDPLTPGDEGRSAASAASAGAAGRAAEAAELAARDSYGRLLALLSASTSDIAAAEDALADAFERALLVWPAQGTPASPDAWLLTVARNRLRDHWRSAAARLAVPLAGAADVLADTGDLDLDALPDRRLELMLVCAHPAIAPAIRTPLMLSTVLGFTAAQIGRAFSVPAGAMATRLVRAKKRIKAARIPFRLPDPADLPGRMTSVLEAVYGAYVIDWATTGPQDRRLPSEALHLAEVLTRCAPADPEAHGLAALVELSSSRAAARLDGDGRFVPLAEQDPARWDAGLIDRAHAHLRAAHARGQLGRFQLEAAIQAVHCAREPGRPTDWAALLSLHQALVAIAPSLGSGVALAAVTAEVAGPAAGLAALDGVVADGGDAARRFQPARAVRAHLLERLGRDSDAVTAYDRALDLTHDSPEREYLRRRRDALAEAARRS